MDNYKNLWGDNGENVISSHLASLVFVHEIAHSSKISSSNGRAIEPHNRSTKRKGIASITCPLWQATAVEHHSRGREKRRRAGVITPSFITGFDARVAIHHSTLKFRDFVYALMMGDGLSMSNQDEGSRHTLISIAVPHSRAERTVVQVCTIIPTVYY